MEVHQAEALCKPCTVHDSSADISTRTARIESALHHLILLR